MFFRSVLKNFFSLSALQAINYITPIIVLPLVIKNIGIDKFGACNYVLGLFIFFKVTIDYGYNLSGVKQITENKNNPLKINLIFSKIFFLKIYLLLFSFILLLVFTYSLPSIKNEKQLVILSFLVVVGQTLLPMWFYQALEKTDVLFIIGVVTRIIYVGLILFFIQEPSDYKYVNFFLGIADCILAIFAIIYAIIKFKVRLIFMNLSSFKNELKLNFNYAKSNLFVSTALMFPYFCLGYFANNVVLGYYGIADKFIQILRTSVSILHSSTFPRLISLYKKKIADFAFFVKRLYSFIFLIYICSTLVCLFIPRQLIQIFTSSKITSKESIDVLRILSFVPLIAALDLLPTFYLLLQQKEKKYAAILFQASIFSVLSSLFFCYYFNYIGAAFSYLFTEVFILFMLLVGTRLEIIKLIKKTY